MCELISEGWNGVVMIGFMNSLLLCFISCLEIWFDGGVGCRTGWWGPKVCWFKVVRLTYRLLGSLGSYPWDCEDKA